MNDVRTNSPAASQSHNGSPSFSLKPSEEIRDSLSYKVLRPELHTWMTLPPQPSTPGSAGIDLHACLGAEATVAPGETLLVPTGLAIHLPHRFLSAWVLSRSGLGIKKGLVVKQGAGLIDSDYQGEILVALQNRDPVQSHTVQPGERIAQLVLVPVAHPQWVPVESFSEVTQRGTGGFGSTGAGGSLPRA